MGIARGPNIVTDNLVFGYDTGHGIANNNTATRFYQGEPTTNLITSNGLDFTVLSSYSDLSRSQVVDSNSPSGYACEMQITDGSAINDAARIAFGQNTNMPSSGNATVSVYAKLEGGPTSNITPKIYNGSGTAWQSLSPLDGGSAYLTYEYRRFAYYGAITANPGFSMVKGNSSKQTGQKTRWHSPQVELTTQASPFVDGIRSDTASLIDLKRTTSIDVSNVSFDSTGQPDFDGSDDEINIGTGLGIQNASFSVEAVIKWDGGSTDTFFGYRGATDAIQQSIHWRIYSTGQLRFDFYGDSINSGGGAIVAGDWTHLIVTYDYENDTCICYKNGTLIMQGSAGPYTGTDSTSTGYVGSWGPNNQHFGGQIPIFRVYNKTLTATEVKQNFNSQKNRFNI